MPIAVMFPNVYLTGHTGVIGRHVSGRGISLHRCGCDLVGFHPDFSAIDTVVHMAQSRRYKDGPDGYEDVWRVNTDATFNLLEAARKSGVRRFIYASSGNAEKPNDVYSASKAAGEAIVNAYAGHMETLVLRFYGVYGPGQRPDALVPTLIDKVRRGEPIVNGIKTKPCWAPDAAAAVERAITGPQTGIMTVSGPDVLTAHEMAGIIGKHLGIEPKYEAGFTMPIYRHSDLYCPTTFAAGLKLLDAAEAVAA